MNAVSVGLLLENRSFQRARAKREQAEAIRQAKVAKESFSFDKLMEAVGALLPVVGAVVEAVTGKTVQTTEEAPAEPQGGRAPRTTFPVTKEPEACVEGKVWIPELGRCQWVSEEAFQASDEHEEWVKAVYADGKTIMKDDSGHEIVLNPDGTGCRSCDKAALAAYKTRMSSGGKSPMMSGKSATGSTELKVTETSGQVVGLSSEERKA